MSVLYCLSLEGQIPRLFRLLTVSFGNIFPIQTKENPNPRAKEVKKKDIFVLMSCSAETLPPVSSDLILTVSPRCLLNKLRPGWNKKLGWVFSGSKGTSTGFLRPWGA